MLMEQEVEQWLQLFLDFSTAISEHQFAYRQFHSMETAVIKMLHDLYTR